MSVIKSVSPKTRKALKMRSNESYPIYAIIRNDIISGRKRFICEVVDFDKQRKQLEVRLLNDKWMESEFLVDGKVTASVITAHVSYLLFGVTTITHVEIDSWRIIVTFSFEDIKRIKMKAEEKMIRRHMLDIEAFDNS